MPPILEVRDLQKRFALNGARQRPVLSGVSFTLCAGECVLVEGPNGAGKSTLLRCIYRTYMPTGGSVVYHSHHGAVDLATAADIDVAWLRREEIGFVTQFLRPRPRVTTLDWVAEPAIAALSQAPGKEQAEQLLSALGIAEELWPTYPATFSGGEAQKVNLARGFVSPRRLLLLDEPTASLDRAARDAVTERLRQFKREGVAMLVVSHHPDEVHDLIDRRIVLEQS